MDLNVCENIRRMNKEIHHHQDKCLNNDIQHSARKLNDHRLQGIEEQLVMAESRCNNLKDQLDYMKHMYGVKGGSAKMQKIPSTQSEIIEGSTSSVKEPLISSHRQKSNQIETDHTGAAVKTINNILNGITNSVNRLSEIHSQLATPRPKISTGVSPIDSKLVGIVPELKIDSHTHVVVGKVKVPRRKGVKTGKTSSQSTIKKPSRIEKKIRSNAGLDKRSSTLMKNRFINKFHGKTANLVEIYHNDALKHSDSDESNLKKSRQQQRDRPKTSDEEVPPLNILQDNNTSPSVVKELQTARIEFPHNNNIYSEEPPQGPRTTVSCCYSKNYELPTVASRMKQVAKSYLGSLNLKTIPFCAAISTSQSHNIGINIQQVMNIIKNRQPINGISPTLAHNIGLAAEKLNSKPFAALVSTINSRISHTGSRCPLSNTYLNYQQLQEQAKTIPEETIEEAEEDDDNSPETQTIIITGPSGDMEIKTKNVQTWKVDKNSAVEQCTCIVQPNPGFQQIAQRYQRNIQTITENSLNSQFITNNKRMKRFKSTKSSFLKKPAIYQNSHNQINENNNSEVHKVETLKGRERNLKEVLTNLHHDFDSLNKKYEDLSQKSQSDADENSLKELERLEGELNKKEEEITMVMALYKEVLALKQQVKQLREKRSHASLPSKEQSLSNNKIKFKEYNNPEAAFHLTKLLKQIQHYQMRYKSNLSQE